MEIEDLEKIEKPQDFEILYEMSNEVRDILRLIDFVEDFDSLEQIFWDDDLRVRMKAFDRLQELYSKDKRFKKMQEMIREILKFRGWTPFDIDYLRKNNNIDGGIRWMLWEDYHYYRHDRDGLFSFHKGSLISDCIDVCIFPMMENGKHVGIQRMYEYAYKYHLVIKVLQKNEDGFYFDYMLGETWNVLKDAHDVYHDEKCFI